MEQLSAPPGFTSLTSFLLKKIQYNEEARRPTASRRGSKRVLRKEPTKLKVLDTIDVAELKRSCGSRPWILYDQSSLNSKESDSDRPDEVTVRRLPMNTEREVLEEALVFHPTEEEFDDTLAYIASIRPRAEPHGICRIVPPSSWKPPCLLEEKIIWENSTFATQVQLFGGIQNQNPKNKRAKGDAKSNATADKVAHCRIEHGPEFTLEKFKIYVDNFKNQHFSMKDKLSGSKRSSESQKSLEPSLAEIEDEYRQLVENPNVEIGVLCGNDLDTGSFGSGFPSVSDPMETPESRKYIESGWNLNNTAKLHGSLLSSEGCASSCVSVPRLRIGMCFSSQFWKAERHHLYMICYMHLGAPRIWYVVPGQHIFKFEATMRNFLPNSPLEEHKLQHKQIIEMSPFVLNAEGIPVHRCIQNPGEFVIIFPGSHYMGFDCGFNCSEKVNFAPLDWLPHGQIAVELYDAKWKKTLISFDKLLLEAAREAVRAQWESSLLRKNTSSNIRWKDACGKDGILSKAFKSRVRRERSRRLYLSNPSQSRRMDKDFDAPSKRECCKCGCDLHLSAVQCPCSADMYSCLHHAKQLCSCPWSTKILLFRYTIDELNVLHEALEGKLSAVYRWARQDLNFSLVSSISRECETPDSHTEEQNKIEGKDLSKAISRDSKNMAVASIKAEVKARVQAKALTETTKLKEEETVASPVMLSHRTEEEKSFSQLEMVADNVLETVCLSSSSESDESSLSSSSGSDESDDDTFRALTETMARKEDVSGCSKPGSKSVSPKVPDLK